MSDGGTVLFDYWRSSAAYRVRIGLNLLGLTYESREVDLLSGAHRATENVARNPQGLVPTLTIDGVDLTQSLAILEYLDETRSAGWLPTDPIGRAKVRALSYAIAMDIHPICNLRVARHAVSLGGTTLEDWMKHFIREGLVGFEGMLAKGPDGLCCYGDTATLADICLVPQIYNARRWAVEMEQFPRTTAIALRLEQLEAFRSAHPDCVHPQS